MPIENASDVLLRNATCRVSLQSDISHACTGVHALHSLLQAMHPEVSDKDKTGAHDITFEQTKKDLSSVRSRRSSLIAYFLARLYCSYVGQHNTRAALRRSIVFGMKVILSIKL